MREFVKYNIRALFYTVIILIGLLFLITIESKGPSFYLASAVVLYFIIIFEISYIWFISKEKLKQLNLPLISNFSKLKQFIHHLLLPTFFYTSLVGFIYFNNQAALHLPLMLFAGISFTTLFINLRAFYQDKYSLEVKTYYVYDFIELMTFFCLTLSILDAGTLFEWNKGVVIFVVFMTSLLLLMLNLYQLNHITVFAVLSVVASSVAIALVALALMNLSNLNNIAVTSYLFLSYYLIFGFLTHIVDGSLKREVVFEYLSIFLLSLAFLFGIN